MRKKFYEFLADTSGVTGIEYGFIAGTIGVTVLTGSFMLGEQLSGIFESLSTAISLQDPVQ